MGQPTFHIYHASAGSGKTFTLVKSYLKHALKQPGKRGFRKLLALTFTNKAVNEMKVRVLRSLSDFSQASVPDTSKVLFQQLRDELQLDEEALRQRSFQLLKDILHNYAFFDISTIDRFNHRLIRTFSKDLGLPHAFEVILDHNLLIEEATDRLLDQAGTAKALTEFLLAYTLQNVEDDRSWDISRILVQQGQLLFKENHQDYLKHLDAWSFKDLRAKEQHIRKQMDKIGSAISQKGTTVLEYLDQNQLEAGYFNRKTLPNHFKKIVEGDRNYRSLYENKLASYFEEGKIFNASMPYPMETHLSFLSTAYTESRQMVMRYNLLRNALANLVPLSVLNAINLEIESIMKEKSWLPISAFNTLISEQIRQQPTPFIYERIGEIYRHFFLDEFQDTSVVQWQNLIPLVAGSLSSMDNTGIAGSVMLVGDAKQAIYRWRGGKAEQFLQLIRMKENPFHVKPELFVLDTNFRSAAEIIQFNNSFFKSTSSVLQHDAFQALFDTQVEQRLNQKKGGYIQFRFMDPKSEDINRDYSQAVLDIIQIVQNKGYAYKDISILVRNNKHAMILAAALSAEGIPLVSPESLLLQANTGVQFLVHLLRFLNDPEDRAVRFEVLYHLAEEEKARHDFIHDNIDQLDTLLTNGYGFDRMQMCYRSLFDICSIAIRQFKLDHHGSSYLQFFLDELLDRETADPSDIHSFLEHWDNVKDKLGIPSPEDWDAIRIMTIHKAKGLEFPIVIYPYANTRIYAESRPKLWVQSEDPLLKDFEFLLLDKKSEMQEYSESICDTFLEEQHRLELDAFNVLYVALTRPVEGLFVLGNYGRQKRDSANSYNELFEDYLKEQGMWQEDKNCYEWGTLNAMHAGPEETRQHEIPFRHTSKDEMHFKTIVTSGLEWDPEVKRAQEYGKWVHQLLSRISYREDVDQVLNSVEALGELDAGALSVVLDRVQTLVDHPQIRDYFNPDYEVRNEQDILTQNGVLLRPDRIMIKEHSAHIIDYKTGEERDSDKEQLYTYAAVLEEMGYDVGDKILIYLSDEINVKFI